MTEAKHINSDQITISCYVINLASVIGILFLLPRVTNACPTSYFGNSVGSKMRYDGIDLINPIDILENENGNYEDVIGQFRTESWEMPLIFRLGASVKPIVSDFHTLILSTDVLHPNNNSESINMGSEYSFRMIGGNTFFLRGGVKGLGIAQANETKAVSNVDLSFSTLTFGLGYEKTIVKNKSIGIDYSYQSIGLLGDVSLITIRFKLF